jgi:hypothetical protein
MVPSQPPSAKDIITGVSRSCSSNEILTAAAKAARYENTTRTSTSKQWQQGLSTVRDTDGDSRGCLLRETSPTAVAGTVRFEKHQPTAKAVDQGRRPAAMAEAVNRRRQPAAAAEGVDCRRRPAEAAIAVYWQRRR